MTKITQRRYGYIDAVWLYLVFIIILGPSPQCRATTRARTGTRTRAGARARTGKRTRSGTPGGIYLAHGLVTVLTS